MKRIGYGYDKKSDTSVCTDCLRTHEIGQMKEQLSIIPKTHFLGFHELVLFCMFFAFRILCVAGGVKPRVTQTSTHVEKGNINLMRSKVTLLYPFKQKGKKYLQNFMN